MFVGWLCIPVIILYRYIIYKYFLLFCGWQGLLPPSEAGKGEERFNPQPQREHGWQLDFSTLAWKIPWTEEPGSLQSMRSLRVRHDWAISLWLFTFMHWRRKWQPTPVFLPGESQGWGSLVGCGLWGRTELDMTEATSSSSSSSILKSRDITLPTNVPLVKAMVFSSGHVQMWELDCEESWAPKNWCFWTVVLEKTLESPLDCKEIESVHSEGDQPWDFFGRNDAKAETPVLWPPHAKS